MFNLKMHFLWYKLNPLIQKIEYTRWLQNLLYRVLKNLALIGDCKSNFLLSAASNIPLESS